MQHIIIIPRWLQNPERIKYFEPRFVKALRGHTILWINRDTQDHELVSGSADNLTRDNIFTVGTIAAGQSREWIVDTDVQNIPYFCYRHPAERGTIVVLPKEEDSMTLNERYRLLNSVFTFQNGGSQAQKIRTGLVRQIDPVVLKQISDEDLVKLQNKILTIVFWDISGFSALCEKLKQTPELVTEFLKEYFTQANKIIHAYNGILDKFIGDGIMAFFGFYDKGNNDGKNGAINGIDAAIKLRQSFNTIKEGWIKIWKQKLQDHNILIDLKCGANTGNVIVGLLSIEERDQFTVVGTEVNLASRLEDKAEKDQIVVSQNTKERIELDFLIKTIPVVEKIKAFDNISEYYEVIDRKKQ